MPGGWEQVQGDPRVLLLVLGRGRAAGGASNVADKGRTRSPGWKLELDKFNLEIS